MKIYDVFFVVFFLILILPYRATKQTLKEVVVNIDLIY